MSREKGFRPGLDWTKEEEADLLKFAYEFIDKNKDEKNPLKEVNEVVGYVTVSTELAEYVMKRLQEKGVTKQIELKNLQVKIRRLLNPNPNTAKRRDEIYATRAKRKAATSERRRLRQLARRSELGNNKIPKLTKE
jgi:hypothetical protein